MYSIGSFFLLTDFTLPMGAMTPARRDAAIGKEVYFRWTFHLRLIFHLVVLFQSDTRTRRWSRNTHCKEIGFPFVGRDESVDHRMLQ